MAGRSTLGRSPKQLPDADREEITPISEKDLEVMTAIGSGAFGQVYSARWKKKNMMVAVKFVNADKKKEFEAELQSLTNVNHPNIVKLYGASIAPPKFHMVMELCATSLQSYIRKNNYEMTEVYRWAYQTADVRARRAHANRVSAPLPPAAAPHRTLSRREAPGVQGASPRSWRNPGHGLPP